VYGVCFVVVSGVWLLLLLAGAAAASLSLLRVLPVPTVPFERGPFPKLNAQQTRSTIEQQRRA
jgi:hypothetical protein